MKRGAIHIGSANIITLDDHFGDLAFNGLFQEFTINDFGLGRDGFVECIEQSYQDEPDDQPKRQISIKLVQNFLPF